MRNVIVATALALSPVLLSAQATSPAQPQSSTLQARLNQPNEIAAAAANVNNAVKTSVPRISTGVIAPKLIHTVDITADTDVMSHIYPSSHTVVVGMVVDPSGRPTDLKIIRSAGEGLDKNVLAAVSQYRFTPGTVSSQPTASPVNLEIEVVNPVR